MCLCCSKYGLDGGSNTLVTVGAGFFLALRVYFGLLKAFDYCQKMMDLEGPGKIIKPLRKVLIYKLFLTIVAETSFFTV